MPPHAVMEGPAMTTETLSAAPALLDGEGVHATQVSRPLWVRVVFILASFTAALLKPFWTKNAFHSPKLFIDSPHKLYNQISLLILNHLCNPLYIFSVILYFNLYMVIHLFYLNSFFQYLCLFFFLFFCLNFYKFNWIFFKCLYRNYS